MAQQIAPAPTLRRQTGHGGDVVGLQRVLNAQEETQ
jgi:hypothetical protein